MTRARNYKKCTGHLNTVAPGLPGRVKRGILALCEQHWVRPQARGKGALVPEEYGALRPDEDKTLEREPACVICSFPRMPSPWFLLVVLRKDEAVVGEFGNGIGPLVRECGSEAELRHFTNHDRGVQEPQCQGTELRVHLRRQHGDPC